MNTRATRRRFLSGVGEGMFVATIGPALAYEMGLGCASAAQPQGELTFGVLEPLVDLMQETGPDKLLPILADRYRAGTSIEQLIGAAALANARAFGGEDYVGFHTMMAMSPAYHMAGELSGQSRLLPVMKVLYRNSNRLHERGGGALQTLKPVAAYAGPAQDQSLRDAGRRRNLAEAESIYASLAQGKPEDALNSLLPLVQDGTEVHRVVMVWRAWSLLDLVGRERAHTMLRQSVHYCVANETQSAGGQWGELRSLLPRLFDEHHLLGRSFGATQADDHWVEGMVQTLMSSSPSQAAGAIAASLAEGISPESISQALSLTANQLVLRDAGRPEKWAQPNKPPGSVHGDSVGVHACDAVNAWCNIAPVSNPRNAAAALMLAGYEVARDRAIPHADMASWKPHPLGEDLAKVTSTDPRALLDQAESGIRHNDQFLACAAVSRYGELGHAPRAVMDLMLKYALSEDGALHAEKYYRTTTEEFGRTRPAYRWRHLAALARVTASAHGYPAPGYDQALALLKV